MKIVIDIDEKDKEDFIKRGLQKGVIAQAIENGTPLDEIVESIRDDMLDYHRVLYMDGNTKGACAVALCEYMVSKYFKGVSK